MATTTVTVLTSEGGYASIIDGALTGDSTRDVTVSAMQNSTDYKFEYWEITIDDSSAGSGITGGGGGTSDGDGSLLQDTRE